MIRRVLSLAIGMLLAAAVCSARAGPTASDDPILHHDPRPYDGFTADTAARDDGGLPVWQRVADDVLLAEPAAIRRIEWWGFYGGLFGPPEPPPEAETIRIRFYHARSSDGLPDEDNIAYEESFLDPSRTWTARYVLTGGGGRKEYVFQADLTLPPMLEDNVPYWLEIAQFGDLASSFSWESAGMGLGPLGEINSSVSSWHYTQTHYDAAFRIWAIPEPSAALQILIGGAGLFSRRKHRTTGCRVRPLPKLALN